MPGLGFSSKVALALTPFLVGWVIAANRLVVQPESQLWIEGTSTVRSFKCAAAVIEADVTTTRPDAVQAVIGGETAVASVALRVPAGRLDCRNNTMNEHMRKALKVDANPTITFDLGAYELLSTDARMRTRLDGTLTLGGAKKDISIEADLVPEAGNALRVKGSYDLRMTEYGLKPPSLMLGTLRVNELVTVNFDLLLKD